jgi:hypothetical protein
LKFHLHILIFSFSLLLGCKDGFKFGTISKDPVIVKVGNRSLFKSQLDGLIHDMTSPTDSAAIVDGFIENWIKENLMIIEAEKNVAADINLNKLIEDYRSSLLVYNYEKKLIENQLDTVVEQSEKLNYYTGNQNQFSLSHPILKCMVAKIPSKSKNISSLKRLLDYKDITEATFYIKEKASFHFLDTARWITMEDLKAYIPEKMITGTKLGKNKVYQQRDGESEYFVKILDFHGENEIPPFEYIEDKINKIILGDRKINLLKNKRQDLYQQGKNNNEFEIFKPNQ